MADTLIWEMEKKFILVGESSPNGFMMMEEPSRTELAIPSAERRYQDADEG